jgi:two-component sensor histidine kinase
MLDWIVPRAANVCQLPDTSVFWLRNASDLLIGASYALIPFGLASFLSERRDIRFGWLAWLFALFIALCGATHWMHIWIEFFPHQTAEAYLKAATALASVTTAGAMLQVEHGKRIEAEIALREALEERSNRELQRHVETQDLLIGELNHRVKNTLATVQAMAALSFRNMGPESRVSLEAFQSRLFALSTAHNLLTETNWSGASLAELVKAELTFRADDRKVTAEGPEVQLTPRQAVSLALVIHELATNSMKYGALRSQTDGRVAISWEVREQILSFRWACRSNGGSIRPPDQVGFGLKMIRQAVERELHGNLALNWDPEGLEVRFELPLDTAPAETAPETAGA